MSFIKKIFNVRMSYIIIFVSLISWAFFAYFTMSQLIENQKIYSKLINISGKQRMLSQKTTLIAKRYFETKDEKLKKHLFDLISLMKKDHQFLITNIKTDDIKKIYFNKPYNLDMEVKSYFKILDSFYESSDKGTLSKIENFSFELLPKLNHAVNKLENESDIMVQELHSREFYILIGTILTLLFEAIFIMVPVLRIVREAKENLISFNNLLKKKVEEQTKVINQAHEQTKFYLNNVNTLIIALDKDANITMFNKKAYETLGFEEDEVIGKNWFEIGVLPKDQIEKVKEYFFDIIDKKVEPSLESYENELITKSGEKLLFTWSNRLLKDSDEIVGTLSSAIDITKEKNQERVIIEQSKLAAMGEMLSNIAHQWRQPLSVISTGATGMKIQKEYDNLSDEELIKTCDMIDENAQYLSQTIEDFRNFLRSGSKSVRFDIKNDTDKFLKLVNASIKNYYIQVILDLEEHVEVQGYPNELIQCFINIFNNSKDELKKLPEEERFIFISQQVIDHNIFITFRDNAGGIPEDIMDKIFEPYFTTKHQSQGTGLGLHMTHNLIVNKMNGTIEAKNVEFDFNDKHYKGAEFNIKIPLK